MKTIFLFLLIIGGFLSAQTQQELEDRLVQLQKRQISLQTNLGSLQNILQKKLAEKSSEETAALSGAFELTQQIKQTGQELENLKEEQWAIKNQLIVIYSKAIDSLQEKLGETSDGDKREGLTSELIRIVEKQWAINPLDNPFSFKMQKIQDIDLNQSSDSLETMILSDYLQRASLEVGQKIAMLSNRENEIGRLSRLHNKARDFLEESSESRPWQITSQSSETKALTANEYGGRDAIFSESKSGFHNTENFYLVLRQLQDVSQLSKAQNGNSMQYLEQIQRARKALQELEKYIKNKMHTKE